MKTAIIVFPGSNCDLDAFNAILECGGEAEYVWHVVRELEGFDAAILPGGFSYGDYLRCGAIARFSPIMEAVKKFANSGRPVLGICNGFQILTEAGFLPGALLRNKNLRFICKDIFLRVESTRTPFTSTLEKGRVLRIPVAHGDGNYFVDSRILKRLEENNQIVFRYSSPYGDTGSLFNPNGSVSDIAGISNFQGNVLGMMPHPERAVNSLTGETDGFFIFKSLFSMLKGVITDETVNS